MIDIRIVCDECGTMNMGYSSRLEAINEWSKTGGEVSPFSGEAICGVCKSKRNHPTYKNREESK